MNQNSYDAVPYTSQPFPQSHPDRLATIATIFGMKPARVERCRVLELGCASGGNLLPMADQFPESSFVGIDASPRQIESGRQLLAQAGMKNVELHCQDILEFASDEPFDYIICHGVYSWVPAPVQQKILQICQQHLSPSGIAYVSYNTYPGWHMRGMIRDIMSYRALSFKEPQQKLNQARGLLTFLSNSVKGEQNPYGLMLKQELESISRKDDSYLFHDYLEVVNEPVYFHEFAERAAQVGLQYLGEAHFGVSAVENFPEQVRGMLQSVSRDLIELEQYMDFLRNRMFRQTLLCRADIPLVRSSPHRQLVRLRVASNARNEGAASSLTSNESVAYRRTTASLTTSDSLMKSAMFHLQQEWPGSIPFVELASMARSTATGRPSMVDSDLMTPATEPFASTLLRCLATSMIDLRSSSPTFVRVVSERPAASALTRAQAELGASVTNRLHESVALDDIQRKVLAACDGQRTVDAIVEHLREKVLSGDLVQYHEGRRVIEHELANRLAAEVVPSILTQLVQRALLIG
jgi:methyltransferase-like protein/SAM-dependent methyltransferase